MAGISGRADGRADGRRGTAVPVASMYLHGEPRSWKQS